MTSSDEPSHRYYRAMHGSWSGRLTLVLTDPLALASSPMRALDRMAWRMTAFFARMLGPPRLETSVEYTAGAAKNEIVHTTRIRQLGMSALTGVETITLDPDGRRFTLRGQHRFAWAPWRLREVAGAGEVSEAADGARYTLDFLGATMAQTTRREGQDVLVVTQTTAFSRAEVRLERRV